MTDTGDEFVWPGTEGFTGNHAGFDRSVVSGTPVAAVTARSPRQAGLYEFTAAESTQSHGGPGDDNSLLR